MAKLKKDFGEICLSDPGNLSTADATEYSVTGTLFLLFIIKKVWYHLSIRRPTKRIRKLMTALTDFLLLFLQLGYSLF